MITSHSQFTTSYVGGGRLTMFMTFSNVFPSFPWKWDFTVPIHYHPQHKSHPSTTPKTHRIVETLFITQEFNISCLRNLGSFREERKFAFGLDIQTPPELWCFGSILGVQMPSQQVFGCEGPRVWFQDSCSWWCFLCHSFFLRKKYTSQNNYDRIILEVIRGTPPKTN